jgi:hypothetical protein
MTQSAFWEQTFAGRSSIKLHLLRVVVVKLLKVSYLLNRKIEPIMGVIN